MLKTKESENTVKELSRKNNEPEWLLNKRIAAYNIFKEKPMPDFIYGLNINLSINLNLDDIRTESAGKAERKIINSNKDIIIKEFSEILDDPLFKEKFMTECVPAVNKFTAFHNAFVNNALLIYVPKNTEIKEPIELITNINSKVLFDHLIIVAEENSKVTLVEEINSKNDETSYVSKIVEIFAGNNAKIDYGNLQQLNQKTFNFIIKRAVTKKDSQIKSILPILAPCVQRTSLLSISKLGIESAAASGLNSKVSSFW